MGVTQYAMVFMKCFLLAQSDDSQQGRDGSLARSQYSPSEHDLDMGKDPFAKQARIR